MSEQARPKIRHVEFRIFFSLVCLLVVVARAVHPTWFDDALDYVPIGLAALPWLGFFVTEVKLPGGIEAKLAALTEEVKAAEAKAEAAQKEAAETKVETRLMAVTPAPDPEARIAGSRGTGHTRETRESQAEVLAARYGDIRAMMPSGAVRTKAMTAVLRQMVVAMAPDAEGNAYESHARSDDEGLRLTAAAWALAHPDRATPAPLIDALYASVHPFVHYWLLMALDQIADRQGRTPFSANMVIRLQAFRPHAATGTDRTYLLGSLLRRLDQTTPQTGAPTDRAS
jgi:hypothetical protein